MTTLNEQSEKVVLVSYTRPMYSTTNNKNYSATTKVWTAEQCLELLETDEAILSEELEHPREWFGYFDETIDHVFPLENEWWDAVEEKRRQIRIETGGASYDDLTVDQKINLQLSKDSCCHWVAIYRDELELKYQNVARQVERMNIFLDAECSEEQAKNDVLEYLESFNDNFSSERVSEFLLDAARYSNDGLKCQVVVR